MKRFYLILLVLSFTCILPTYSEESNTICNAITTVYSDGRSVIDTLYQDTKSGIQTVYGDIKSSNIYPDIKTAVNTIAKSIGVAAEHVYGILVKKYVVIAVKELLLLITALILIICGYIDWNKKTSGSNPITYKIIPSVLCILISIILLIQISYDDMLMGLINPEYGALNYILDYSKSIIK